jgi:hypothetical protein
MLLTGYLYGLRNGLCLPVFLEMSLVSLVSLVSLMSLWEVPGRMVWAN